MNGEIHALFPLPVYKEKIRLLDNNESNFIESTDVCYQTLGNAVSLNTRLLDAPTLIELRAVIEKKLDYYLKSILKVDNEIYITNSWLNKTNYKEQHFLHNHSNSILSGVYYINTEDSLPLITFNRMQTPFLLNFIPKEFTIFNSTEWSIPVENGCLIIFPSSLYHYVKINETTNTRTSIAFNSFVKGSIGFQNGSEITL
jgi:uncharacterized protein (TIGR02466 family)